LVDDELISDLGEESEDQLLNGDGTGENFTGLAETAGVLVQAWDTDIAVTARKAITNLLINGKQIPTAYLFNPQDWESFDLLQDDNGRYYWGGPMAQGPRTLWGVPVAQSFFQDQGTGWLGNWRKMVVWDSEEAMISATDSHEDFFIRNLVAILGEMRAAMGVIRPSAFVEIDLTSGS
jgi:HK97 family phage major capsid protein